VRPIDALVASVGIATIIVWTVLQNDVRVRPVVAALMVVLALACAGEVALTGWRWTTLIACLAGTLTLIAVLAPITRASVIYVAAVPLTGLYTIMLAASAVYPPVTAPGAAGPYRVGTTPLDLASNSAARSQAARTDPAPEINVWYPIARPERRARSLRARLDGIAAWLAARADTAVISGARPVAAVAPFPVLLYFSGWEGTRVDDVFAIEGLASDGFVVASVTYGARAPGQSQEDHRRELARLERPMEFSSEASARESIARAEERVRSRARDAHDVLDVLARLDAHDPSGRFTGRLDLNRIGIFGYSLGGAVAAEATWLDPRFKAAANLDGWHFGEVAEQGLDRPYLFMSDATPLPTAADFSSRNPATRTVASLNERDNRQSMRNMLRHGGIYVVIAGTTHVNFSDAALRSPLRRLTGAGPLSARRAYLIFETYLRLFFAHYVAEAQPSRDALRALRFPEAQVQIWEPPANAAAGTAAVTR